MNNNATMPQRDDESYDKLYKVRPFIETWKANFRLKYHPTVTSIFILGRIKMELKMDYDMLW